MSATLVRTRLVAGTLAVALALSPLGRAFLQKQEGTRTTAYLDSAGVPTICTGSTKRVFIGQHATLQECEERLQEDTKDAGRAIHRLVHVRLSQEQYDALLSLVFNIGEGAFARSTLLKKLNTEDYAGAAAEFDRWVYAGGKKLSGLQKRRDAEQELFLYGRYNVNFVK